MRGLARVRRGTAWKAVDRVLVRQPQPGTSRLADLGELAQVRQETSWKAAGQAWGR